ncbi:DNA methyltransferase [Mesorhizobium sp. CC13]|uniref:DNA-methyltransferase n=1 Tax=Mesorhizobium sp. CC13 TaxID=3029194 RepID=UPI0032671CBC
MASGEMSSSEFTGFLGQIMTNLCQFSTDGSLHYHCMDWRHARELLEAASGVYSEFKALCVWNKTNAGMGSLYRSEHELVHVYKHGTAPHVNNVQLGRHGRYRTNVWDYPGVNTFRAGRMDELSLHPTVKPVALVADAIRDCTKRGALVLDPFVGSAYLAHIPKAVALPSLPKPNKESFRVYVPRAQRRRILATLSFETLQPFRHARVFAEEIAADPSRFVLLFRDSMIEELDPILRQADRTTLLYSLWPGYLDQPGSRLRAWCADNGIPLSQCHTSGHADPHTLSRLARSLNARHVIPIHAGSPLGQFRAIQAAAICGSTPAMSISLSGLRMRSRR